MTDSSKINSNNDFGANKAGASSAAKANSNLPNSGYKNSANSQSELVLNEIKKNNSENGKQLDYEIRHSNPILYEALKDSNKKLPEKNKEKKAPPEPSLRVKLAPKGPDRCDRSCQQSVGQLRFDVIDVIGLRRERGNHRCVADG
jgi:hypothetical protein